MNKNSLLPLSALSLAIFASGAFAASYQVVPLDATDKGQYTFASGISGDGDVLLTLDTPYSPLIDISLLDLDNNEALSNLLESPDDVKNGVISKKDLAVLFAYVNSQADSSPLVQRIARYVAYLSDNDGSEKLTGFDVTDSDLGDLTNSVTVSPGKVNTDGVVVGTSSAPYLKLAYTNESDDELTYLIRDFASRGFVRINGQTVALVPQEVTLGGYSEALGISDNLWVAGISSVDKPEGMDTAIANCDDDEKRPDVPVEYCYSNARSIGYMNKATLWKLDNQGNMLDSKTFDLPFTPAEDDTNFYPSRAVDVNNAGIAVGTSFDRYPQNNDATRGFAAVFADGKTTVFANNEDYTNQTLRNNSYLSWTAAINNHNQVVGQTLKLVNGFERTKFFVYDLDEQTLEYPDDFFPGSSSVARDINDAGLVVGDGEVETTIGSANRRRAAFLYDLNDKQFRNLNDLVACDSPYTLVQGNAINENGEIAATATYKRAKLDIVGEPLLDDAGNQIMEEAAVAVKLVPIPGGNIDDCSSDDDKIERQGASFGWWMLGLLGLGGLIRRR
ncbi:hypothetical protein GCM10009092_07160 [Bowmanella denitrificans]|uniref:DUF3466 family protein n=1 Tax=Bowmanella denitrificans TaxID=366582 RepID=A0ABP3GGV9_9ALTE